MGTPALAGLVKTIKAMSGAKKGAKLAAGAKEYMSYRRGGDSSEGPSTASSGGSGGGLHPMAQQAMSLDMGFYGHPHAKGKKTVVNSPFNCRYKSDGFNKSNLRGKKK